MSETQKVFFESELHLAAGALKQRDLVLNIMVSDVKRLEHNVVEHAKKCQHSESEARTKNRRLVLSRVNEELCTEHRKIEQRAKN
eukprot:3892498-Amphidinium_carterae.1